LHLLFLLIKSSSSNLKYAVVEQKGRWLISRIVIVILTYHHDKPIEITLYILSRNKEVTWRPHEDELPEVCYQVGKVTCTFSTKHINLLLEHRWILALMGEQRYAGSRNWVTATNETLVMQSFDIERYIHLSDSLQKQLL
jgi:hypothetical protein